MKPFNLELAKQGHPVCTRNGEPARIVCFDRESIKADKAYPILALVKKEEYEEVVAYCNDGTQVSGEAEYELFMIGEKKTGWVNIYDEGGGHYSTGNVIYDYEQEAVDADINERRIDTIQIEFEV